MYIAIYVLYHTVHLYSVHTYVCTVYGIWYIYSSSILVYYIISQFSKKLKVVVHVAVEKENELTRTNNLGNGNKTHYQQLYYYSFQCTIIIEVVRG